MRYGLAFLRECTSAAFERNVEELVQLGRYSYARHKELVQATGIVSFSGTSSGLRFVYSARAFSLSPP